MWAFHAELSKFAKASDKPVVIFIDELDRCRPEFAVRLIERIKHFFDVPNLVFVLLMNRAQLESAIRGVYGPDTDAAAYLGKFLPLSLRLPKNPSREVGQGIHPTKVYVHATLRRYGFQDAEVHEFAHDFAACAALFDLSLRDVERGCALYVLAERSWAGLLAYLIALKLRCPAWFRGLQNQELSAHKACWEFLNGELPRTALMGEPAAWPACYFDALRADLALASRRAACRNALWLPALCAAGVVASP